MLICNHIKKVKCAILLLEFRRGAHLPSEGHEPVGRNTTIVCDAWPVRRQTYGYLPSRIGWYQIILLGNRGMCELTTCPGQPYTYIIIDS